MGLLETWKSFLKEQTKTKCTNITNLGMTNKVNLCESCKYEFATCKAKQIIFGTGLGNDNVAACDTYLPLRLNEWVELADVPLIPEEK